MDTVTAAPPATRPEAARRAAPAAVRAAAGGEVLTFRIGEEEYGIDILRVQEIRPYEPATRIANAPAFLKGVINLRGVIVPIVDLRLKLGCADAAIGGLTVVVVLNVRGRVVGAVVDSVSDVLELAPAQVQPAPDLGAGVDARFITGIGTVPAENGERMLILLDIEALMTSADMGLTDA